MNLGQHLGRTLLMAAGMAGAGFFLAFVVAASVGLPEAVFGQIERAFPAKSFLVKPKPSDFAMLRVEEGIGVEKLGKLRRLVGVETVHPIEPLRVPTSLSSNLFNFTLQTDVVVWGVPPDLIELEAKGDVEFEHVNWRRDAPVRVVVPSFYLDMYNSGLATASGLPKVSPAAAIGRDINLHLGTSTIGLVPGTQRKNVKGVVVGMTANAQLLGILLPLSTVSEMNRWYEGDQYKESYVAAQLVLASLDHYESVEDAVGELGLMLESHRDDVAMVRTLTLCGVGLLAMLGAIVAAMALINMTSTYGLLMHLRRSDSCLFLAVGGTRPALASLYIVEAALIATLGGLAGALVGWGLLALLQAIILDLLPDLTILPDRLLWLSPLMPLGVTALLGGLGAAIVAPLVWRQASRPPATLMSSLE